MKRGVVLLLLALFLLAACSQSREFPVGEYEPSTLPRDDGNVRPVINKTAYDTDDNVEDVPDDGVPKDVPRQEVPELSTPVEEYRLEVGYGTVGLNTSLGRNTPPLTKYEFPELLKSRNVRSGIEPVAGTYEQFLKLRGGRVLFTGNERDEVSDFLVYRDGEPIFDYRWVLSDGSFLDFLEAEIWFLGHRYVIADATEKDVILRGVDTSNELIIGGGTVRLNGEVLEETDSRMTGDEMIITMKADAKTAGDDIFIPPEHSLQEYLGEQTILTDKLDIRYKGIMEVPHTVYEFNNKGDELELWVNEPGRQVVVPIGIITEEGWAMGDEEGMLHVKESTSSSSFPVKTDDYFILTAPGVSRTDMVSRHRNNASGRVSAVFQYKDITPQEKSIELVSREGVAIEAFYNGTPGSGAGGRIPFAGHTFSFSIGSEANDYPLAIDLNGDQALSGATVDLVLRDSVIDLPAQNTFTGPANISIRLIDFGNTVKEETSTFEIMPDGEFSIKFFTDREVFDMQGDDKAVVSDFGTQYFLFDQQDDLEFEEVRIDHPLERRIAEIVIESR